MGLDLYAGPLTRYYSGDWQTEMQQLGAQVIYADGEAPWISPEDAKRRVEQFHAGLAAKLAPYEYVLPEWQEAVDHAYATVKPDHKGREALLLWAAYILRRDLKRPKTLPADITTDRAYREAHGELKYYEPHLLTLDTEMFIPATADFALAHESPLGAKKIISSTSSLMNTLMWINERSWNTNADEADKWLWRGLPHEEVFELKTESARSPLSRLVSFTRKKVAAPSDWLEQAAQYGFACYTKMLTFSIENNVPIVTDM